MADTVYEPVSTNATTTVSGDDGIQHGIDDNPNNDAEKGAKLGGVGGAVTGAIAGAAAGPLGMVAGAIIGGVAGAVASGAAVAAVDAVDNDNTISGIGGGATTDVNATTYAATTTDTYGTTGTMGTGAYAPTGTVGNGVPGVQTGGYANDGTPDTRGILEKTADAVTGDATDDKTGRTVYHDTLSGAANSGVGTGISQETALGETTPSIKTGGYANDGTPDTRGVGEKVVDAVTGDTVDDKTGKVVNHS